MNDSFLWSMPSLTYVVILFSKRRSDCRSRLLTSWCGSPSMKLIIRFLESTFTKTPFLDRWRSVSHCSNVLNRKIECTIAQSTINMFCVTWLVHKLLSFGDVRDDVFLGLHGWAQSSLHTGAGRTRQAWRPECSKHISKLFTKLHSIIMIWGFIIVVASY